MSIMYETPFESHGLIGVEVLPHDLGIEALPPEVQAVIRQIEALGDQALLASAFDASDMEPADLQPASATTGNYL